MTLSMVTKSAESAVFVDYVIVEELASQQPVLFCAANYIYIHEYIYTCINTDIARSACRMASRNDHGIREAMKKMWGFLDLLAETNPDEYKKFIDKAMEERKEFLDPPQPIFCFSTGIRGKDRHTLYVNVCNWSRIPLQKAGESDSIIPVKGGILRHLVEEGKRRKKCLLIDIAFNPYFIEANIKDGEMMRVIISMTLDFLDDYLTILTNRDVQIVPQVFKGPEKDIGLSLDQQNPELMTRESWIDLSDNILTSLRKSRKKTTRKGTKSPTLPPLLPRQRCTLHSNDGRKSKLIEEIRPSSRGAGQTAAKAKQRKTRRTGNGDGGDGEKREGEQEGRRRERVIIKPDHTLMVMREGGRSVVCVRIKLPDVTSVSQMKLDSSVNDMCLLAADKYLLSVPFPFPVNADSSQAKFSKRSRTLSVKLPAADM